MPSARTVSLDFRACVGRDGIGVDVAVVEVVDNLRRFDIRDVERHYAADAFERDERVCAPVDDADVDAFGLRALVVGPVVEVQADARIILVELGPKG